MKRIICTFLCCVLCIVLISCSKGTTTTNDIKDVMSTAIALRDQKEYGQAIYLLERALLDGKVNDDARELYFSIYDEFLAYAFTEAENVLTTSGHIEAVNKLKEYNSYFSTNEEYNKKIEFFEKLAPVYLMDISPTENWDRAMWTNTKNDIFGNEMKKCIVAGDTNYDENYVVYSLDYSYESLTGTLVCSENANLGSKGRVYIYADNKLTYSSPVISTDTEAFDISVNISGIKKLKIEVIAIDEHNSLYYDTDIILSEFKLNKY